MFSLGFCFSKLGWELGTCYNWQRVCRKCQPVLVKSSHLCYCYKVSVYSTNRICCNSEISFSASRPSVSSRTAWKLLKTWSLPSRSWPQISTRWGGNKKSLCLVLFFYEHQMHIIKCFLFSLVLQIKQVQDEERKQLTQLRDVLKTALQVEQKEVTQTHRPGHSRLLWLTNIKIKDFRQNLNKPNQRCLIQIKIYTEPLTSDRRTF